MDFYCHDARLSIEIDGSVHKNPYQQERDKERTFILKNFGITELRFTNSEVEKEMDNVISLILTKLNETKK